MTANAIKLKSTPLGPYIGLMENMSREEKLTVVAFLVETMREDIPSRNTWPKSVRQVPDSFKKLRGMVAITEEDMAKDERLAYIMRR